MLIVGLYFVLRLVEGKSLCECSCKLYIYGLVDCSSLIWRSEACWMFLWFVDNQLVKIVEHLMRVLNWWSYILADKRTTITRHHAMLLM